MSHVWVNTLRSSKMEDSLVVFALLTAGIGLSFSASFFEPVKIHAKGSNFRSTQVLESHQVSFKGECALMCDSMGNSTCQGFNVRIKDGKNQCQLLQNIPTNFNHFAQEEDFFLYERTCETISVIASLRASHLGFTLTTLIDNQQKVYQIVDYPLFSERYLKLWYVGTVEQVFIGHTGPVDDLLLVEASGRPLYGIRSGAVFRCYEKADWTLSTFTYVKDIEFEVWVWYHNLETIQVSTVLSDNKYLVVGRQRGRSSMHIMSDMIGPSVSAFCPHQDKFGLCEWMALWENSKAVITYSQTVLGVFVDTSFYIYDLDSGSVRARHKVCKDRPALYLLSIDQSTSRADAQPSPPESSLLADFLAGF